MINLRLEYELLIKIEYAYTFIFTIHFTGNTYV